MNSIIVINELKKTGKDTLSKKKIFLRQVA